MKLMLSLRVFCLLLHGVSQTLGVHIQSDPGANGDGLIQTELEKTVSLLCSADAGSEDSKELVWLRNGERVQLTEENKQGRSSVCITPVVLDDNGATFTCRLSKNASDTTSVTLRVTYGPQLSGSEEVTAEEESELLLQCDITANPPVSSVSWTLNETAVDLQAGGFTVTNDGHSSQLSVSRVARGKHEGSYHCIAASPLYGQFSRSFSVTVTDKTLKFPLMPMIAGLVVVVLTALLAAFSRRKKILKCFK